jgi:simple sugar transport system permease protein
MILGTLASLFGAYFTGSLWVAVIAAVLVGALCSLIVAFLCITLRISQGLAGFTFVYIGTAVTALVLTVSWPELAYVNPGVHFNSLDIPFLSQAPIIGPIFFQHNVLVYLAIILVPVFFFIINRTTFGLNIRSVGENPHAADTLGVNVTRVRYLCTITAGAMAGLGGAFMALAYSPVVTQNLIVGRGWMAVSLVAFSNWNPFLLFAGALLYGGMNALQLQLQTAVGTGPSSTLLLTLPYVVTIFAMMVSGFRKRSARPSALAQPYVRDKQ